MKRYTIKNYKGDLLESVKKFQDKHSDMRIVEAVEDGEELRIKADSDGFCQPYQVDKILESTTIQNVKWAPFDPENDSVEKGVFYIAIDKNSKETVIFKGGFPGMHLSDVDVIAKDIS